MDREIAQHFRDELRQARAVALKDAEAFEQIVFVFERLGVYLTGRLENLAAYQAPLTQQASKSPLCETIPKILRGWHAPFSTLYEVVRRARNEAMHEGAYARQLTRNAIELSIILEDALMIDASCARDFMVRDPVCAYAWQPASSVRRAMLANSFSFLPVAMGASPSTDWKLISDYALALYLRAAASANERNRRLARKLNEAIEEKLIELIDAPFCSPEDTIATVLERSEGRPVLVTGENNELLGIVTPFDVL